MSIAAGLPKPKVYIIPDSDPNAFATGRDPEHGSIAVTRGLLDAMTRDELQGVVAHELSHVRNLDIRLTLARALEKIEHAYLPTVAIKRGSAHLCIADPLGRAIGLRHGWLPDLLASHPPMPNRISALRQMGFQE